MTGRSKTTQGVWPEGNQASREKVVPGDTAGTRAVGLRRLAPLLAVVLFMVGCMVGPNYVRPPAPVAQGWIETGNPKLIGQLSDQFAWWKVFNDPVLDRLVDTAYRQNLPLRVAGLRIIQARAIRGIAVGGLFPQVQEMFGNYFRTKLSGNGINQLPPEIRKLLGGKLGSPFDLWSGGFDAAWELDFWGRFRRAIQAADADLDASVENYDSVLVMLLGEVATTYVNLRTFQERLRIAQQNVAIQQGSLRIADVRFRNGAVTELDVTQAKSNLAETEALIPRVEIGIRRSQNALCVLLGIPPESLAETLGTGSIPRAPKEVAVGIPADLLRQRPDVLLAERRVAAQSPRIGIAISDLYPRFTIAGRLGVQANRIDDLFQSGSFTGVLAPGFRWDILNYGRLLNNIRVQEAIFEELVVEYQNTVLQANKEVEDGIIGFLQEQERVEVLTRGVEAAKRSVDLSLVQYRDGAIDFNRVYNLESLLVHQQDALALSQGRIAANLISIYKALGGGWQIRCAGDLAAAVEEVSDDPLSDPGPEELQFSEPLPPAT